MFEPKIIAFLMHLVQLYRGRSGRHHPPQISLEHPRHPHPLFWAESPLN